MNLLALRKIAPKGVHDNTLYLSLVSFFMNFSSGLVMCAAAGSLEGLRNSNLFPVTRRLGEGCGQIAKVLVGFANDASDNRKLFLLFGYGAVLLIKPLFVLSVCGYSFSLKIFAIANILDRTVNSFRDLSRDVLISLFSDNVKLNLFFRKQFSCLGTLLGSIIALGFVLYSKNIFILYIFSVIPAIVSFLILLFKVQDVKTTEKKTTLKEQLELFLTAFNTIFLKDSSFILLCVSLFFILLFSTEVSYLWKHAYSLFNMGQITISITFIINYVLLFLVSVFFSKIKTKNNYFLIAVLAALSGFMNIIHGLFIINNALLLAGNYRSFKQIFSYNGILAILRLF